MSLKPPYIFLDTAKPDKENRYSYLFTDPVKILKTKNMSEIPGLIALAQEFSKKYWVAGFVAYEAAYSLENIFQALARRGADGWLVWLGVFKSPRVFSSGKNPFCRPRKKGGGIKLQPSIDRKAYLKTVRKIKALIARGDTYQVNYSFNIKVNTNLGAEELYLRLKKSQETPYCAFIETGDETILSFSPELFFEVRGGKITLKPMKGTARRGITREEDEKIKSGLKTDKKNMSENIMIVDLIRSDLGRICTTGSVKTKNLFEVETHPTLHQMTSRVTGRLKKSAGFAEIIKNIFPSGSVTGAPKIRTMQIIRSLENSPRGVYCGAIGFLSPASPAGGPGKMVFSVPIRTLSKKRGSLSWDYRSGSGIVWSSDAESEWEECLLKSSFLRFPARCFEIVESLLWDGNKYSLLSRHIKRLKNSARYFGYPLNAKKLKGALKKCPAGLYKVRILLNREGEIRRECEKISLSTRISSEQRVLISKIRVKADEPLLYHKTTFRPWYEQAQKLIKKGICFDVIYFNREGELTEGSRTNVFIEKNGRLYTPPVKCGLLGGTLREGLIESGACVEKILKMKDLKDADAVYLGNSVRGLQRVEVQLKDKKI